MLSFIRVIPTKNSIRPGESLNILGGAANHGETTETDISVWANIGDGWVPLVTQNFRIEAGEHKHLYFTITPDMLLAALWNDGPEEFELIIQDTKPKPDDNGVMVFVTE